MGRPVTKPTKCVCAQRRLRSAFLHADSEESDQTGRIPRLIWVFARRTSTLLVLSWGGSNVAWSWFDRSHIYAYNQMFYTYIFIKSILQIITLVCWYKVIIWSLLWYFGRSLLKSIPILVSLSCPDTERLTVAMNFLKRYSFAVEI